MSISNTQTNSTQTPHKNNFITYLQYSSQIVETGAICLEFSPNFLHSLLTPSFSLKFAPLLPQCWATRILEPWDDCNTQINIGEGENHTSVSRFVTSIVAPRLPINRGPWFSKPKRMANFRIVLSLTSKFWKFFKLN